MVVPTLAKRLGRAMDHVGLNPYRLHKKTGVDIGTITKVLAGTRQHLEHETMSKLAVACGVRAAWLSIGDGPMTENAVTMLRDRPEWPAVLAGVIAMHPELSPEDVGLVGENYDHPKIWSGPLDVAAVAALAAIQRDWRARAAARTSRRK
jgi:hypothetical protein